MRPLLLLLVLAGGNPTAADEVMLEAMRVAALEALPAGSTVRIVASTDAAVGQKADGVAALASDDEGRRVSVRLDIAQAPDARGPAAASLRRVFSFSAADSPDERGRTMGFFVAAALAAAQPQPVPPPPPVVRVAAPAPAAAASAPDWWELEAAVLSALDTGPGNAGWGGRVGLGRHWGPHLVTGAAVRARRASSNAGRDTRYGVEARLGWEFLSAGRARPARASQRVRLGVSAALSLDRIELRRDEGGAQSEGRFLPAGWVRADVGARISGGWSVLFGLAAEVPLGRTEVWVGAQRQGALPNLFAVATAGLGYLW